MSVLDEMPELKNVELIGFEYILTIAYLMGERSKEKMTALKAIYKYACHPAIRFGMIPATFREFLESLNN